MFLLVTLLAYPVQILSYIYEILSIVFYAAATPFVLLVDAVGKLF